MTRPLVKHMAISAILLGSFAVIGAGLVAWIHQQTAPTITANEQAALLRNLHSLVPPEKHDNKLTRDTIQVRDEALLGTPKPVTVYRARKEEEPVTAILNVIAPDGYGGPINLLVAIRYNGELAGVRVINHRETPGLGDAIEADRSDWIHSFEGKSLDNPDPAGWKVEKDSGEFDQFTGATVTPRAVVKAVHNALKYYQQHREQLFRPTDNPTTDEST
ncbi:electron transport complex subunit RsxG [Thiohalophilus sp.]|uniref:electron transport complex subunit RsxG n=1 Tax=Thiohalophilus sp. TaxID=3028392 RepID=UPI0039760374